MVRNGFHWPLKRTSGVGERNLKRFLAGSLLFMHPYPCAQNQWKIFTNARFPNKFFRDTKITSTFVKASLLIPRVRSLYWFVAFNPFSVNERAKTRSPPCNNNIDDFH